MSCATQRSWKQTARVATPSTLQRNLIPGARETSQQEVIHPPWTPYCHQEIAECADSRFCATVVTLRNRRGPLRAATPAGLAPARTRLSPHPSADGSSVV